MKLSLRGLMKPKMSSGGCMGASCSGCSDANCYSKGGRVSGVHEDLGSYGGKQGVSPAGHSIRKMKEGSYKEFETTDPKESHKRVLSELKTMKKPNLYAKGGRVDDQKDSGPADIDPDKAKSFVAGFNNPNPSIKEAWDNVKTGLGFAEGGEVEAMEEPDAEEERAMQEACAGELMDAFERKDKAQILDAMKALVLSVR